MARTRRLVIEASNGANVTDEDNRLITLDLTDLLNADSRAPLTAVVEEQCDMGHWHRRAGIPLPCWGD
jgi:hypothetical protein